MDNDQKPDQPDATASRPETNAQPVSSPRVIRSDELFAGRRVLVIEHSGQQYRLLITRNNRLILQK